MKSCIGVFPNFMNKTGKKMNKLIILSTLGLTSLFSHYHEPSITFHVDERSAFSKINYHFSIQHQSTLELEDRNIIILHALSDPYSNKTFHHEGGVGYRKIGDNFGFGVNFVYANQNSRRFLNHHLVPGVELFYDCFSLVYNRYLPVKNSIKIKDTKYMFHDISEACLSYRAWEKYEFSFTSNFNHDTKKFGYGAEISVYFLDNFKFSVAPYCEPEVRHGFAFSLGYCLGGPKKNVNQTLKKSHRFFFTSKLKKEKKSNPPVSTVFLPDPEDFIFKPAVRKPVETQKSWWERVILDFNRRS